MRRWALNRVAAALLGGLVRAYQLFVSPLLAPSCRYLPTCSEYAREAFARHGAAKGGRLAAGRLLRCHPWGGSGLDPVPGAPDGPAVLAPVPGRPPAPGSPVHRSRAHPSRAPRSRAHG